ncbi:hypothetical protein BG004_004247 [Podila humilis]|nr:hypothetical protein BG004_004247 [Podila humilis]
MDPQTPKLPTGPDGYIDEKVAATGPDSLAQRINEIDEQLSEIESIDGNDDDDDDDDDGSVSDYSTTSSSDARDIQREWDENMEQGRQLFAIVIFPYIGKWMGKKMSYWIWTRFLQHHYKFQSIGA